MKSLKHKNSIPDNINQSHFAGSMAKGQHETTTEKDR
jgi:hypothetical protein